MKNSYRMCAWYARMFAAAYKERKASAARQVGVNGKPQGQTLPPHNFVCLFQLRNTQMAEFSV